MKKVFFILPLLFALLFSNSIEAKKKKYPNGDFYEGEWKKKSPHGFGTMIFANGNVYKGCWNYGKFSGEGIMMYNNNDQYEGNWENNARSGKGKLTCKNGDTYDGIWQYDKFIEGSAIVDNTQYVGKFDNGLLTKGKKVIDDGTWFDGEWSNGKFINGKCKGHIDKNFYDGMFVEGNFVGNCKLYNPNKEIEIFEGIANNDGSYKGKATFKEGFYIGDLSKELYLCKEGEYHIGTYSSRGTRDNGRIVNIEGNFSYNSSEYRFVVKTTQNKKNFTLTNNNNLQENYILPDTILTDAQLFSFATNMLTIKEEEKAQAFIDKYLKDKIFVNFMNITDYDSDFKLFQNFFDALDLYLCITVASPSKIVSVALPKLDRKAMESFNRSEYLMIYQEARELLTPKTINIKIDGNKIIIDGKQKYQYDIKKSYLIDDKGIIYKNCPYNEFEKIKEESINSIKLF